MYIREKVVFPIEDYEKAGVALANKLKEKGAADVLASLAKK